jgi:hypothetical protein
VAGLSQILAGKVPTSDAPAAEPGDDEEAEK